MLIPRSYGSFKRPRTREQYWEEMGKVLLCPDPQSAAVLEFHQAFNHPANLTGLPEFPERKIRDLRIALIAEEFEELLEANDNDDLVGYADALGDLLYVIYGAAITHGIPLHDVFMEIHRSNMSKLGADNKPIYRPDGKVLKGPNYTPPDIKSILNFPEEEQIDN